MTGDFTPLFYCHERTRQASSAPESSSRATLIPRARSMASWPSVSVAPSSPPGCSTNWPAAVPCRSSALYSSPHQSRATPRPCVRASWRRSVRGPRGGAPLITIPTAHIWGTRDDLAGNMPSEVFSLCARASRSAFVHNGGHEVPTSEGDVTLAVNAIRRCILQAQEEDLWRIRG